MSGRRSSVDGVGSASLEEEKGMAAVWARRRRAGRPLLGEEDKRRVPRTGRRRTGVGQGGGTGERRREEVWEGEDAGAGASVRGRLRSRAFYSTVKADNNSRT